MAGLTLEKKLVVDGKEELQEVRDQGVAAFKDVGDEGEAATSKASKGFDRLKAGGSKALSALKVGALVAAGAIAAIAAKVAIAVKVAEAGANVVAGLDTAASLGLTADKLDRVKAALDGTIDSLTAATSSRGALLAGIDPDRLANLAKTASFIAVKLGESKSEMFKLAAAGELTDDQLSTLGLSTLSIEAALTKAAVQMGRDLTVQEQRRTRILTILRASRRVTQNFTADTKDAGDASARVLARFKDLKDQILLKILPGVNKFLGSVVKIITTIEKLKSLSDVGDLVSKTLEGVFPVLAKVNAHLRGSPAKVKDSLNKQFAFMKQHVRRTNDYIDKANSKAAAARRKAAEAARAAAVKRRLEEIRGFQEEARSLIRNFGAAYTDLIGNLGGTFSGVIASMKEIPEKFRIFSSLGGLRKALRLTLGLTVEQIDAQRTHLGLSDRQVKAAKLFSLAMQAGRLDQIERVNNERAINIQLRAGLSTLASTAKIAQTLVEKFNAIKDVRASQRTLDLAISRLQAKERDNLEKLTLALLRGQTKRVQGLNTETRMVQIQLANLLKTRREYAAIAKERARILSIQLAAARLEQRTEIGKQSIERRRQLIEARSRLAALDAEIQSVSGRQDAQDAIRTKAGAQLNALRLELQGLALESKELRGKLAAGLFGNKTDEDAARRRLETIQAVIGYRQIEIDLVKQRRDVELQALGTVFQLQRAFQEEAIQFPARFAQTIKGSIDGLLGGFANLIAGVFEGMVSGADNFGQVFAKGMFDLLAGLAIQIGTFLITAGTGYSALLIPSGGVAIAAGLGLVALGGVLKGIGALVSQPAATPAAAAAPPSPGGNLTIADRNLPGPGPQRRDRETFTLMISPPWEGSPEDQRRRFDRWLNKTGRVTRN